MLVILSSCILSHLLFCYSSDILYMKVFFKSSDITWRRLDFCQSEVVLSYSVPNRHTGSTLLDYEDEMRCRDPQHTDGCADLCPTGNSAPIYHQTLDLFIMCYTACMYHVINAF